MPRFHFRRQSTLVAAAVVLVVSGCGQQESSDVLASGAAPPAGSRTAPDSAPTPSSERAGKALGTVPDQPVAITIGHSGKCLDLAADTGTQPGAALQNACSGLPSQRWEIMSAGGGHFRIKSTLTGRCLTGSTATAASATHIGQQDCAALDLQAWRFVPGPNNTWAVLNAQSGLCMDVSNSSLADFAPVIQWTCSSPVTRNQQFHVEGMSGDPALNPAQPAQVKLVNRSSRLCLVPDPGRNGAAGAATVQMACAATGTAQDWNLVPFEDGTLEVRWAANGLCLDVPNSSTSAGLQLTIYGCHGGPNQRWKAVATALGHTTIRNVLTGQCIDNANNLDVAYNRIQQNHCNESVAQDWQGVPISLVANATRPATAVAQPLHPDAIPKSAESPYLLKARVSGHCLDGAEGNVLGAVLMQQSCLSGASQEWFPYAVGDQYVLRTHQGSCLAVGEPSMPGRRAVVLAYCDGAATQLWSARSGPGGMVQVVSAVSGHCLNVEGAARKAPAPLGTRPCVDNQPEQLWLLTDTRRRGAWSALKPLTLVASSIANLPDGKLLMFSGADRLSFGTRGRTYTAIYDPVTDTATEALVTQTGHEMFCPGISNLDDGSILVSGGTDTQTTSIWNASTRTWLRDQDMKVPRGYQANTTLADGSVFTLGGSWSGGVGGKGGEVWSRNGGWRLLPGVPTTDIAGPDTRGLYRGDNHMWLFTAPDGRVFHAGPHHRMHWITTAENGSVTDAGPRGDDTYAMNGNAVLFDIGRLLTVGGAPDYERKWATRNLNAVDINGTTPAVLKLPPMGYARAFHNSVALPNGQVVIIGGQSWPEPFTDDLAILVPELWDPAHGLTTQLVPMAVPRTYHSVALLMADGRVFVSGSGQCGTCTTNHADYQILTPPYLQNSDGGPATRPLLRDVATSATWGDRVTVTVQSTQGVAHFALMRLSSTTHTVNNDQRRVPLVFEAGAVAGQYTLQIPSQRGVVTPGNYFLFVLDQQGVPSVARTIRIGS